MAFLCKRCRCSDITKETTMRASRGDSKRFCHRRKFGKRGNTLCIFRFANCTDGAKELLSAADDFIGVSLHKSQCSPNSIVPQVRKFFHRYFVFFTRYLSQIYQLIFVRFSRVKNRNLARSCSAPLGVSLRGRLRPWQSVRCRFCRGNSVADGYVWRLVPTNNF